MRLFELLLLLTLLPPILWPLAGRRRPAWVAALPLLGLLFLAAHLLLEGGRWQMVPAYALTAVLALLALRHLRNRPAHGANRRSRALALAAFLLLALAAALPLLLPVPRLPAATGPYPVGTTSLYLVDNGRTDPYAPQPGTPRELMVQFWYPAAPTGVEPPAVYLPQLNVAGPVLAREFNLPSFIFDHANLADLDMTVGPPLAAGGPFPVILFAHGLTGVRMQNTSMARQLASHGYVVAALDHTYANALTVFPDGRVILYDACRLFRDCRSNYLDGGPLVRQWARDLSFLLDTMAAWDETTSGIFAGGLNTARVGVFGHSTGGGAALQFCQDDARCAAGAGLDAWVLPLDPAILDQPPPQPFLFISTPEWLGAENRARGEALVAALPGGAADLRLPDTGHYDFSDMALLSPLKPWLGFFGTANGRSVLTQQANDLLAFFDHTLRGAPAPEFAAE